MEEAKAENRIKKILGNLASAWISLAAFGVALATIVVAIFGAVWRPAWTLNFLGIQEQARDTYPTISTQGNIQLAAEASNVFEKLGPVGDYFGGTINPILTFISICLLLWSIKIQRDELKETRKEMQAATLQAEKTASASRDSVRISKISARPLLELYSIRGGKCAHFYVNPNEIPSKMVRVNLFLYLRNVGRGVAFLKIVKVELFSRNFEYVYEFNSSNPRGSGSEGLVKLEASFDADRDDVLFEDEIIFGTLEVIYLDSFDIKYTSKYDINLDDSSSKQINIDVEMNSFTDSVDFK